MKSRVFDTELEPYQLIGLLDIDDCIVEHESRGSIVIVLPPSFGLVHAKIEGCLLNSVGESCVELQSIALLHKGESKLYDLGINLSLLHDNYRTRFLSMLEVPPS